MKYTTLENLKNYLNITDNNSDAELEKIINITTKIFDKYLGFNLGVKTYREFYKNFNSDKFYISFGDKINKINQIKLYDLEVKNYKIENNIIIFDEVLDGELFIEYEAGYSSLEEISEVEYSALKLCKKIFEKQDDNIRTQSIDKINISYFSQDENQDIFSYENILKNYKKLEINKI